MSTQAQTNPVHPQPLKPAIRKVNLFSLHGGDLRVSFSPVGTDGKPHLEFHDSRQKLTFSGNDVRTVNTEIGTLVTVTLHLTVDGGSTSFTLCVPQIGLQVKKTAIHTFGVTTQHRIAVSPVANQGPLETYMVTNLVGSVQAV